MQKILRNKFESVLSLMDIFGKPNRYALSENEKKRNFILGVINGVFFIFSEALIDPTLVLSTFVNTITNSPLLVGLVVPLRDGYWALP